MTRLTYSGYNTNKFRVSGHCILIIHGYTAHKNLAYFEFCDENLICEICYFVRLTSSFSYWTFLVPATEYVLC